MPTESSCSESSLLAALGDADADTLWDGGSIPPTSTDREGPPGPFLAPNVANRRISAGRLFLVPDARKGERRVDEVDHWDALELSEWDPTGLVDRAVDLGHAWLSIEWGAVDHPDDV